MNHHIKLALIQAYGKWVQRQIDDRLGWVLVLIHVFPVTWITEDQNPTDGKGTSAVVWSVSDSKY